MKLFAYSMWRSAALLQRKTSGFRSQLLLMLGDSEDFEQQTEATEMWEEDQYW